MKTCVLRLTAQGVIMNDEKQKQRILNDGLWKLIFDFSGPATGIFKKNFWAI